MRKFKVGIIGFGLIGQKRAKNLGLKAELVAYSDIVNIKKNILDQKKSKVKFFKNTFCASWFWYWRCSN